MLFYSLKANTIFLTYIFFEGLYNISHISNFSRAYRLPT